MEKMQRQLATLVADVGRLKNSSNAGAGSSSDKLANVKCHKCGELGHLARNCPNKPDPAPKEDEE